MKFGRRGRYRVKTLVREIGLEHRKLAVRARDGLPAQASRCAI
jgi:hypothetical protein